MIYNPNRYYKVFGGSTSAITSLTNLDCGNGDLIYIELSGNASFSFLNMLEDVYYTFVIKATSGNIVVTLPTGDVAFTSNVNITGGYSREFSCVLTRIGGTLLRRWIVGDLVTTI